MIFHPPHFHGFRLDLLLVARSLVLLWTNHPFFRFFPDSGPSMDITSFRLPFLLWNLSALPCTLSLSGSLRDPPGSSTRASAHSGLIQVPPALLPALLPELVILLRPSHWFASSGTTLLFRLSHLLLVVLLRFRFRSNHLPVFLPAP